MKESNRKYLEKYGFDVNISDDVAEEIKCYRGKLCRYSRTHTKPECGRILEAWQKRYGFSSDAKNIFQKYIDKMYEEMGDTIPSPRLAAIAIMDGLDVYNTKNGLLVITDIVDFDGRTKKELLEQYNGYGIEDNNGEWLLALMYCNIDPDKAQELRRDYGSLCAYALGAVPAPGTGAADRMGDWDIMCFGDIVRFFEECYEEEPDGWTYAREYDSEVEEPSQDGQNEGNQAGQKDDVPEKQADRLTEIVEKLVDMSEALYNQITDLKNCLHDRGITMTPQKWDVVARIKNCELTSDEVGDIDYIVSELLETEQEDSDE